jgi:3-deoxy-manno-octulosonate cytidylyltransferase (CMP-KDO synthetase)
MPNGNEISGKQNSRNGWEIGEMNIAAVIPARYQSSRFPGKPLAKIAGITMIERVYQRVVKAGCFADVIVATDDERIFNEVLRFGGKSEMTDMTIKSGSERVWAVIENKDYEAVINIQGDEPLISEKLIREVYQVLGKKNIVSAARRNDSYLDFGSKNIVKVVCNNKKQALYFSRAPIPFCGKELFNGFFQHIGIYGYTKKVLQKFIRAGISHLEKTESLEQLRFLFLGEKIHIIETDYISHSVDVPDDIGKIEKILQEQHA